MYSKPPCLDTRSQLCPNMFYLLDVRTLWQSLKYLHLLHLTYFAATTVCLGSLPLPAWCLEMLIQYLHKSHYLCLLWPAWSFVLIRPDYISPKCNIVVTIPRCKLYCGFVMAVLELWLPLCFSWENHIISFWEWFALVTTNDVQLQETHCISLSGRMALRSHGVYDCIILFVQMNTSHWKLIKDNITDLLSTVFVITFHYTMTSLEVGPNMHQQVPSVGSHDINHMLLNL